MTNRWGCLIAAAVMVASSGLAVAGSLAEPTDGAGAAAAAAATTAPARDAVTVQKELSAAMAQLRGSGLSGNELFDVSMRPELQKSVAPKLRNVSNLLAELADVMPQAAAGAKGMRNMQILPMLAFIGDSDAISQLKEQAASADVASADSAKSILVLLPLIEAGKDETAKGKALDEIEKAALANPKSNGLTGTLETAMSTGLLNADQVARVEKIMESMTSPRAQMMKKQAEAVKKLKGMEHKPIVIKAKNNDGTEFDSTSLKGKVVLVDFWATWCGPCKAELPRVKAFYKKYHDQGLEIVGVSCDNSKADLDAFLKNDPEMSWTQLFDETTAGWHPLAKEYGIDAIPTMFLIDRKGVLRSVKARENYQMLVPQLLAEKAE